MMVGERDWHLAMVTRDRESIIEDGRAWWRCDTNLRELNLRARREQKADGKQLRDCARALLVTGARFRSEGMAKV